MLYKELKNTMSDTVLVCCPYLGGAWNAFSALGEKISHNITILSINPPGHGPNRQPALENLDEMADLYLKTLEPKLVGKKVIFLGYSLGGFVALKSVKKLLENNTSASVSGILLLAAKPPHTVDPKVKKSHLPNKAFADYVNTFGNIPPEIYEHEEFLDFLLKPLRSDMKAIETIHYENTKLDTKAFVIYGTEDPYALPEYMPGWENYFVEKPELIPIEGGHMFLDDTLMETAEAVNAVIGKCLGIVV